MKTPRFWSITATPVQRLTPFVLAILLAACSSEEQGQGPQGMPPAPVTLTQVETSDITQFGEYAARVRGAREVEVRARVSGILEKRRYTEGDIVEQGETLFQIEAEPYEIALKNAEAELADAHANHTRVQREWERVSGLFKRKAVSEREHEQANANLESADARLVRAKAAVEDAQRSLRYTRVEAPVRGITGMEAVSEGNLIEPGALLTHVTQHDPVHVHFALPEQDAMTQRQTRRAQPQNGESYQAHIQQADGSQYQHAGTINFTNNRVDARTGSVTVRAEFPNPDGQLLPGQFVRVRLALNKFEDVFLIDPTAVSEGPNGAQVFTINGEDKADARPVRLGPIIDGKQVILDGLAPGDRLVVNGHVALRDGAQTVVAANGQGAL